MIISGQSLAASISVECDICILGCGVAGTTLANELVGSGMEVIVLEAGGDGYSSSTHAIYAGEQYPEFFPNPLASRQRMLGGSSNHWENNTSPLDPIDFERRSWVADSGWPISYEDLQPFYAAAGVYCGVGDDGYDSAFWSSALNATDLAKESPLLGTAIAKASLPPTRFFAQHGERLTSDSKTQVYTHCYVLDAEFDVAQARRKGLL